MHELNIHHIINQWS